MANIITGSRILGSAGLLFCPVLSPIFYVLYLIGVVSGYVVQKRLVMIHTFMNKVAGALIFVLPLTLSIVPLKLSAIPVCAVATFAAVQEGHFIRRR